MIGALAAVVLAAPIWSVQLEECGPRKIEVIKIVRSATGLGLKDAKDLVEAAPQLVKSGLERADADALADQLAKAGAMARIFDVPNPTAPAPQGRTQGRFAVTLVSFGTSKIAVIKLVREATGLGLKETKELVERAPAVVKEGLRADEAEALAERLRRAGATAKVSGGSP